MLFKMLEKTTSKLLESMSNAPNNELQLLDIRNDATQKKSDTNSISIAKIKATHNTYFCMNVFGFSHLTPERLFTVVLCKNSNPMSKKTPST